MYQRIEKPPPQKCAKLIKIFNIAVGAIIIAFGVVGILFMAIMNILSGRFFLVFAPIFQIIFGCILVASEFKISLVRQNFGFLSTLLGRGVFNLYLSTSVYFYFSCGSSNIILAWVCSMILFGTGVFYIILHFCTGQGYGTALRQQIQ